jgi:membrane protein YqaA with SNARE-associated domain
MLPYLALVGVVLGANLLPAFGPPTWSLLVFFRLQSHIPAVPLVLIGAIAAASGRLALAFASRHFRDHLSVKRLESLAAARDALAGGRKRALAGLGVFALSPVPSSQLFIAAGLVAVPIVPLTAAFFAGRLVSYSVYVTVASAVKHSLGSTITSAFASPLGIALQIVMLAGLVALIRVDWTRLLTARRRTSARDHNGVRDCAQRRAQSSHSFQPHTKRTTMRGTHADYQADEREHETDTALLRRVNRRGERNPRRR